ncbi:hypothetical protein [Streptomyces sp. NPDC101165]
MASGEKAVWSERIADRLTRRRPDAYGKWKGENVTSSSDRAPRWRH